MYQIMCEYVRTCICVNRPFMCVIVLMKGQMKYPVSHILVITKDKPYHKSYLMTNMYK